MAQLSYLVSQEKTQGPKKQMTHWKFLEIPMVYVWNTVLALLGELSFYRLGRNEAGLPHFSTEQLLSLCCCLHSMSL